MAADVMSDSFRDTAAPAGPAAADLGNAAAESFNEKLSAAAAGLESGAASLHTQASAKRLSGFAHGAADKLSSTADYLREHDMKAMVEDVKMLVKKNPVPALLGATALGFLLAKAFSSRD